MSQRTLESELLSEFFFAEFWWICMDSSQQEEARNCPDLDLNHVHVTRTIDVLEKLKNKIRNDQILFRSLGLPQAHPT